MPRSKHFNYHQLLYASKILNQAVDLWSESILHYHLFELLHLFTVRNINGKMSHIHNRSIMYFIDQ